MEKPTLTASDSDLDVPISLEQARQITKHLDTGTLRRDARSGKLRALRLNDRAWLTTRRWVAEYLETLAQGPQRGPRGVPRGPRAHSDQ